MGSACRQEHVTADTAMLLEAAHSLSPFPLLLSPLHARLPALGADPHPRGVGRLLQYRWML